MRYLTPLRNLAIAAVVAATSLTVAGSSADASDYHRCASPTYSYKKITVYSYHKEWYKKRVVGYSECGDPVIRYRVAYRTVRVPATKWVKAWH